MVDALVKARMGLVVAVCAGTVALSLTAPASAAAESRAAAAAPLSNQNAVVQEAPPPPPSTEQPAGGTTTQPSGGTAQPSTTGQSVGEEIREDPGYGNASRQPLAVKADEAKQDCVANRPPISKMLGIGGIVAGDQGTSWNGLVIVIALVALLVAITAFLIRRHRSPSGARTPRGALEIVSTVVAILGGVVGLAVQFVPGVGVKEKPAREAAMTVRDVQARITRGEYAKKTGATVRLGKFDRRQVGNVIWLEIALQGYSGKNATLQYAMYDPNAGGALLPGTAKMVPLRIEDKDSQKSFVPIWVGYPKSQKFRAQFRLLVGEPPQVRQLAETGAMPGSQFRYSC